MHADAAAGGRRRTNTQAALLRSAGDRLRNPDQLRRLPAIAAARAMALKSTGDRHAARRALADGRASATAMLELTPYTLRHTMATELRRRGVAVREVAGFLGHTSGYKTTERYAKFGPDHLSGAVRAIDAYFADLEAMLGGAPLGPVSNPAAFEQRATGYGVEPQGF